MLETIRVELHNRRKGDAVRLEIEAGAHPEIVERLRTNFELEEEQVFQGVGPVNLSRIMFLYSDVARPDLKFPPFAPRPLMLSRKANNIFEDLRTRDILLHHPYDSYDPVVNFIQSGASDPNVVSIKQTLYRTSSDSPMFQALIEAAATKEATVVVELMARFDEASNIRWARTMEDSGVQVFHGVVGLKTHCKLALLVRRDHIPHLLHERQCVRAHLARGALRRSALAIGESDLPMRVDRGAELLERRDRRRVREISVSRALVPLVCGHLADGLAKALQRSVDRLLLRGGPRAAQQQEPELERAQLAHGEPHGAMKVARDDAHRLLIDENRDAVDKSCRLVKAFGDRRDVREELIGGHIRLRRHFLEAVILPVCDTRNEMKHSAQLCCRSISHAAHRSTARASA